MVSQLEEKKIKAGILKAEAAKADLEVRIEERREDIARMEDHMRLQDERIADLKSQLKELKK